MTLRQTILQRIYPLLMKWSGKKAVVRTNKEHIRPPQSFYNLHILLNDGKILNFASLKGKKVLIVNTASDCGYTAQYQELQQLYQQYKSKLWVIGFPANDFKNQEKENDAAIAAFCAVNFGVRFLLAKKTVVTKKPNQNKVFQWLTDKNGNGWNNEPPEWNFSKYLIDEHGILTHYFPPSLSPVSTIVTGAINQ